MSMQQLTSPADMSALIKDIRQDAREIRQDAKAERDELESKLKAEYKVEMQQQKAETEARHTAEVDKLEARHKTEMDRLRGELTPEPAQELVSVKQLAALQARLESLHAAQLLSDEEFFALENLCSDFLEVKAATVGPLTQELVYSSPAKLIVVSKLAKLVVVSEGLASDAGLARQVRRKFL